jgi:hypothetical protein
MFGVGEAFEEAIGGAEHGEGDFGPADERSEVVVMALARFAEKDRLDAASGAESLLDEPDPFNADAAGFGGQAAAEGHAKSLQPAIVPARENRGSARGASQTGVFTRTSHYKGAYQISRLGG